MELADARPRTALADAERALALCEAGGERPEPIAGAKFVVARALAASRGDRGRARRLAEDARVVLYALGPDAAKDVAEVDEWLAQQRD